MLQQYWLWGSVVLSLVATGATGADATSSVGLLENLTGYSAARIAGLDELGVTAGGWATAGFTFNRDAPGNHGNGPVSFNYRANEFHLYQMNLFWERQTLKTDAWSLGGRLDVMFGTDAPYTQASGHWDMGLIDKRALRLYDLALPQAYAEVYTPFAGGVTTKIGHFYSIIGYESVAAPPNFFMSHTYSMKSSPFTVTGFLSSYALNGNITLNLGAVSGPDNFDRKLGAWDFMGGAAWNSDDHTSGLSFSILNGPVDDTRSSNLSYYTLFWRQDLTAKLHYVLQHDRGVQHAAADGRDAEWYSIVHCLTYDLAETWGIGMRGEWFRDDDGVRYADGAAHYFALTGGLNWKPADWIKLRPEVRYDWADAQTAPFDGGRKSNQLLVGLDAVVQF